MSHREFLQLCDEQHMKLATAQEIANKACWASFQTGELDRKKTIISVDNEESVLIEQAIGMYIEECHRILEERERKEQN